MQEIVRMVFLEVRWNSVSGGGKVKERLANRVLGKTLVLLQLSTDLHALYKAQRITFQVICLPFLHLQD